jgi:hypothetical protein
MTLFSFLSCRENLVFHTCTAFSFHKIASWFCRPSPEIAHLHFELLSMLNLLISRVSYRCPIVTDSVPKWPLPGTVPYRTVPYRTVPYRTVPCMRSGILYRYPFKITVRICTRAYIHVHYLVHIIRLKTHPSCPCIAKGEWRSRNRRGFNGLINQMLIWRVRVINGWMKAAHIMIILYLSNAAITISHIGQIFQFMYVYNDWTKEAPMYASAMLAQRRFKRW